MDTYTLKNAAAFKHYSNLFKELLQNIDRLLATNTHFLLGRWLESAKSLATTSLERQKYEYNARNQITLWGPQGQIVDYANKQWSGVVQDFFLPRWSLFLQEMELALATNGTINETKVRDKIFRKVELPFNTDRKKYPAEASGEDALELARELYQIWSERSREMKKLPREVLKIRKKGRKSFV